MTTGQVDMKASTNSLTPPRLVKARDDSLLMSDAETSKDHSPISIAIDSLKRFGFLPLSPNAYKHTSGAHFPFFA